MNGVQTAVPNNKYTIQRIYVFISGLTFIQFGQQLYDTITQAKLGIDSEPFVTEINNATDACLRAVLIVKEDATDLTDSSKAVIFNANKFGDFNIGKSVTDLQGSYNNSQDGVVSTSTTNNAVKFKRGTAADSDNVLEILDGSGATSFYVKGDGSSSINALLDGKANTSHTHVAADITDLSKTSVGLSNVQNVDQTNASNISSGTLSNARLTANLSQIGGLTLVTNDFLQFNGTTVTNVTPTQLKTSIGLNNVTNNPQVINAGNGVSFASGAVVSRPAASINGRFYIATDTGPYLDNGSSWIPLQVAITGDISISANGTTATLPNVNSNIGTFNNVVVNAKGQVTSASNANYLIDGGSNGVLVRTALNTTVARTVTGTTNQISLSNGDGVAGNPVIAIANNPIIPGTASLTLPIGTIAQRDTPIDGQIRYNSDTSEPEISRASLYLPLGKVIQFIVGDIIQTTGTTILPYDATKPTITEGFQIWAANVTPLSPNSTIVVMYSIFTECNSATRTMLTALYKDSNAIAVCAGYTGVTNTATCLSITKSFASTDTIPIAITARAGPSANATMYVNRGNTETMGGLGVTSSHYIIMEIL